MAGLHTLTRDQKDQIAARLRLALGVMGAVQPQNHKDNGRVAFTHVPRPDMGKNATAASHEVKSGPARYESQADKALDGAHTSFLPLDLSKVLPSPTPWGQLTGGRNDSPSLSFQSRDDLHHNLACAFPRHFNLQKPGPDIGAPHRVQS